MQKKSAGHYAYIFEDASSLDTCDDTLDDLNKLISGYKDDNIERKEPENNGQRSSTEAGILMSLLGICRSVL